MTLDRFYPIFDTVAWFERALPLGVRFAQLRVKDRAEDELRPIVERVRDLCSARGATLVVNDHWRLAIELGCDFVHLGQEDLDTADVSAIRRAGIRLGVSTHDHDELERALALDPDYVALGPVYPTRLKAMKWDPQGLERITEWKRAIGERPLVAIGGLDVERAPGVFEAGADVASVVTDVTLHDDPDARLREWMEVTR